jgi:hypothetical protein
MRAGEEEIMGEKEEKDKRREKDKRTGRRGVLCP